MLAAAHLTFFAFRVKYTTLRVMAWGRQGFPCGSPELVGICSPDLLHMRRIPRSYLLNPLPHHAVPDLADVIRTCHTEHHLQSGKLLNRISEIEALYN